MKIKVRAYQKYIRQTPRKLRLVAELVRGRSVMKAKDELEILNKKAAQVIRKVLVQAEANAKQVSLLPETLRVETLEIQEGPTFKRWNAVSRGRAHSILKRSSHIHLTVSGEKEAGKRKELKKESSKKAVTKKVKKEI